MLYLLDVREQDAVLALDSFDTLFFAPGCLRVDIYTLADYFLIKLRMEVFVTLSPCLTDSDLVSPVLLLSELLVQDQAATAVQVSRHLKI